MNHSGNGLPFLQTKQICDLRGKAMNTVILPIFSTVLQICLHAKSNFY